MENVGGPTFENFLEMAFYTRFCLAKKQVKICVFYINSYTTQVMINFFVYSLGKVLNMSEDLYFAYYVY